MLRPSANEPIFTPGFPVPEVVATHPAVIRRHRWLTLPSSAVLFLCIFLPTLRVCGKPTIPLQWPMFWTPYVVAALVFAGALLRPHAVRGIAIALRIVIAITVAGFGLLFGYETDRLAAHILVIVSVTLVVLAIALPARSAESMCARCGLVVALPSIAFFIALASDPDGLFGAHLSVVAAIAMALGCAWWWSEAALDQRTL